ncbi:MAG: peptidoglycan recognition protein family protein [Thermincolia bacterium]
MKIIQDFIYGGRKNRPGTRMTPKFITIHDTQNLKEGADAEAHARFLKSGGANVPASWHFTVDHDSIVQHLPLNEAAFHAGDGRNGPGNTTSIAVEITENPDGNRAKAEANAAELVASLLKQFNLTIDSVVQHNRWSGKDCPRVLRSRANGWKNFIKAVSKINTPILDWKTTVMKRLLDEKIITTSRNPDSNVTWAELAAVIGKVLDRG